jgi:hypothetical protein
MKNILATSFLILAPSLALSADLCQETFLQSTLHLEQADQDRVSYVQEILNKGFEKDSYVVDWDVKSPEFVGPLASEGEFVVTRVTPENRQVWLETIGKDSIGFTIRYDFNPQTNETTFIKTAWFRVGETIYDFKAIQSEFILDPQHVGLMRVDLNSTKDLLRVGIESGFVEATFKMTPDEIAAIKEFVQLRTYGKVVAKTVIPGTKEVKNLDGTVKHKAIPDKPVGMFILPKFNEEKMGLVLEGCAGACSSFLNPEWYAHIDPALAAKLEAIKEKYELFPTPVARQLIWRNSRNPHVMGLTLIEGRQMPHDPSFIDSNSWGNLRGMAIYGTIPDPVGDSKMVNRVRIPIKQWLEKQKK